MVIMLILLFTATVFCIVLSLIRCRLFHFTEKEAVVYSLLTLLFGCVGVKGLYLVENFGAELELGGLSFYGAVFFVPIGFWIYSKATGKSWTKSLDFVALYGALFLGFMRINCFISGCCAAHTVVFMGKTITPPIQLIEVVFDFLIFLFLLKREEKPVREGAAFPLYITLYGFLRLVLENYRATNKDLLGMSRGQWYSILCVGIGGTILYMMRNRPVVKRKR